MDARTFGSVLAVLAAYQNNVVTSKMMTSQVVQCLLLQMSTKVDFRSERVNALTGGFNPVCPISCFLKSKTVCLFG